MPNYFFLDFETWSLADLKKVGTVNYANHPSTRVLCMAFCSLDDSEVSLQWQPKLDEFSLPSDTVLVAHNVFFEQAIFKRFAPQFPFLEYQWVDTMALAAINNVNRGLDRCAKDIGLSIRKHEEGAAVLRTFYRKSKPATLESLSALDKEKLGEYCMQDTRVTVEIFKKLFSTFTAEEQKIWALTNRSNWAGVPIDLSLVTNATNLLQAWQSELPKRVDNLTNGLVKTINQVAELGKFLKMESVVAPKLVERLKTEKDPSIRSLIKLRLEGGKKSVSKFDAALNLQSGGKLFGTMDYHAASTGRFASNGVQLQNLIRADRDEADEIIFKIKNGASFNYDSTPSSLSRAVRGMIIPPEGHDLIKADYAQIEARILAWLAGDKKLINEFATGGKVYEQMAANIFDVPLAEVTSEQRFFGKSAVLGCGYGMGAAKFAATYKVSEELAQRSVSTYRRVNKLICHLWRRLEDLIKEVIENGRPQKIGPLVVWRDSWRLFIKLPGRRNLVYPYPRVADNQIYHKTRKMGQFKEVSYWGGTFVENICQAISRDLLTSALLALEGNDTFHFLFTVHDELVYSAIAMCYDIKEFEHMILLSAPPWAQGIPLEVEVETHDRYFK